MPISPIGNSDAYERYRNKNVDLLAPPGQEGKKAPHTTFSHSHVEKADVSGAPTNVSSAGSASEKTENKDTFQKTLEDLEGILNTAAKIASVVI